MESDSQAQGGLNRMIIILTIISILLALGSTWYKYFYAKNYDYLVEASCDPNIENCFVRDCENPDDCPPNGLSIYKEYYIKAYDFQNCSDNSCTEQCSSGAIKCEVIECGNDEEDSCSADLEQ